MEILVADWKGDHSFDNDVIQSLDESIAYLMFQNNSISIDLTLEKHISEESKSFFETRKSCYNAHSVIKEIIIMFGHHITSHDYSWRISRNKEYITIHITQSDIESYRFIIYPSDKIPF